jgi:hypothetical protein
MKKLLIICVFLLFATTSFGQLTINQALVGTATSFKVGDTIQVKYTVARGVTKPRYFWLRYQFNNKALAYVSTTWSQGSSVQTYYTGWSNYKFTPSATKAETSLYEQYLISPWGYAANSDWNVGQLTVQRTDASVDGIIATQKYVVKDLSDYTDIHKLSLSYSIDDTSAPILPITTTTGKFSLSNVVGNTSQFKVRVLFPSGYDITKHQAQLMPLKQDSSGDIDWTKPAIASKALDASGEAIFTTEVKVGDSIGIWISGATQQSFMNNIITVSDAYKAFLGISQTDISGAQTYFTYPVLEKKIGYIAKDKTAFSESDSYYMFAYVMGIDVKDKAHIPTNAAPVNNTVNYKWYSGLLNQSWLDGTSKHKVTITSPIQAVDAVYSWGGDLDWSHSSAPSVIATRISTGNYNNSVNPGDISSVKTMSVATMSYEPPKLESAKLGITSTIENGKVILSADLTKADLAGLEVIMQYDNTKLTLENVIFDAGNNITNFSTHNDGRLTFGSMDQIKTARIKVGTPYKLIFNTKTSLTNTAGLFYTVLADAVDGSGKKVNLIVE